MNCKHCNVALKKGSDLYCCAGCEIAYNMIASFGLAQFYDYCKSIYNRNPSKVMTIKNELNYEEHVVQHDGYNEINLIVEGIHCGSCIWLIESTLNKNEDVQNARINLSTKRMKFAWKGGASELKGHISTVEKLGYRLIPFTPDAIQMGMQAEQNILLKYLFSSALASMMIMMIMFGVWFGNSNGEMTNNLRDFFHILSAVIAFPAVAYSGTPFFKSALAALRAKKTNMDVPISIGVIASLLISMQEVYRGSAYTYFDAPVSLLFFLLIGRYLDMKMRNKARNFAQNLVLSQPMTLTLITADGYKLTGIKQAKIGDMIFVAAGDRIPVDGVITKGVSDVDTSIITGESMPQNVVEGSFVHAGMLNNSNPLEIKIINLGDDTTLAKVLTLIENAEQTKAKYVQAADRISSYFTPAVLLLSVLTFVMWLMKGALAADSLLYAVSVLIITCPCALALAVPVTQIVASGKLLSKGIIIKAQDALEKISDTDMVIFDKTGTLTLGHPVCINFNEISAKQQLEISSLALRSNHALAKTLAAKLTGDALVFNNLEEIRGQGIVGKIARVEYKLGRATFVNNTASDTPYMEVWFKKGKQASVQLIFKDEIKSDALDIINWCKGVFKHIVILSGDKKSVVDNVANELGVMQAEGELTPEAKYNRIQELSKKYKVLMIGDGLNDSAALKAAYSSISPSSAIELTQNYADVVFQGHKLEPIRSIVNTAKRAQRIVKENFALSLIYNLVTVPYAMMGYITPIFAALIMSFSSIMVVLNALRLNRDK